MGWTVHLASKRKVRNLYDFPQKQKDRDQLEVLGVGGDNIKIYCERLESSISGSAVPQVTPYKSQWVEPWCGTEEPIHARCVCAETVDTQTALEIYCMPWPSLFNLLWTGHAKMKQTNKNGRFWVHRIGSSSVLLWERQSTLGVHKRRRMSRVGELVLVSQGLCIMQLRLAKVLQNRRQKS